MEYRLRWNDHNTAMLINLAKLREDKSYTDVTLSCEGKEITAHRQG